MTDPMNDPKLIDFLKRNCPNTPQESLDLEQRIMFAIEAENDLANEKNRRKHRHFTFPNLSSFSWWVIPPALVASLLAVWSGPQLLNPTKLSPTEEANLEAFVIHNWEGVSGDLPTEASPDRELDWYPIAPPADQ